MPKVTEALRVPFWHFCHPVGQRIWKNTRPPQWTYSFAEKHNVYGLHIVVVLWCSESGRWCILLAFCLWRPKRTCPRHLFARCA
jgi:hypothetical protein